MKRLLIANRGEIARRVIRTARRLGIETVAVYAAPDADAPFVTDADIAVALRSSGVASSRLDETYLSIEAIIAAAIDSGADAVHPGYGFLSENAAFATAVEAAGLTWVGPSPTVIAAMGSKIEARRLARTAGVAVIPGFDSSQDPADLAAAADTIGYPVLVKASAGGGGKGIRVAHSPADFAEALRAAADEAERTFGDHSVIVERYVSSPRHIEVQIAADQHGHVIHLGTRECSIQRRYQKLFEEAPAPHLSAATTDAITTAAVQLAASVGYDSLGTVEFVLDGTTEEFFFLEMNTRLQVEHPVTEMVTDLDLVEMQLRAAVGETLWLAQDDVVVSGHALEARIAAEDATAGFAPQVGTVTTLVVPDGVRWDSAIEVGSTVSPHYDSMVAKLIVSGRDRTEALDRMRVGLDQVLIGGLVTNTGFQRWLVDHPKLVEGTATTRFLDETDLEATLDLDADAAAPGAAAAWRAARRSTQQLGPWAASRRVTPHSPSTTIAMTDGRGDTFDAVAAAEPPSVAIVDLDTSTVVVNHLGQSHTFAIIDRSDRWAPTSATAKSAHGDVVSPFPAVVATVHVAVGDQVVADDALVTIEAMKMLHTIAAPGPGRVASVAVAVGDTVAQHQRLITFESVSPTVSEDSP